jgi:hypothetical protein
VPIFHLRGILGGAWRNFGEFLMNFEWMMRRGRGLMEVEMEVQVDEGGESA